MEALRLSGSSSTLRSRSFLFVASSVSFSSYWSTSRVHRICEGVFLRPYIEPGALVAFDTRQVRSHPSAASAAAGTRPSCLLPRTFIRRFLGVGTRTGRAYTSGAIDRTSPWNAHPTSAPASTTACRYYAACQANSAPLPFWTLSTSTR